MTGQVTADREAIVSVRIRGASGAAEEVDALLDTGFTDAITLHPDLFARLQLPFRETAYFETADGNVTLVSVFRGAVVWHGPCWFSRSRECRSWGWRCSTAGG